MIEREERGLEKCQGVEEIYAFCQTIESSSIMNHLPDELLVKCLSYLPISSLRPAILALRYKGGGLRGHWVKRQDIQVRYLRLVSVVAQPSGNAGFFLSAPLVLCPHPQTVMSSLMDTSMHIADVACIAKARRLEAIGALTRAASLKRWDIIERVLSVHEDLRASILGACFEGE